MATILDGKALAEQCKQEVKKAAETLARRPGLAVIIVGNNPASRVYVNSKRKDCEECGFFSEEYALPEETTQGELIALIEQLNQRQEIDGILCQHGHLSRERRGWLSSDEYGCFAGGEGRIFALYPLWHYGDSKGIPY